MGKKAKQRTRIKVQLDEISLKRLESLRNHAVHTDEIGVSRAAEELYKMLEKRSQDQNGLRSEAIIASEFIKLNQELYGSEVSEPPKNSSWLQKFQLQIIFPWKMDVSARLRLKLIAEAPPRTAEMMLYAILPADQRKHAPGDLEEEFHEIILPRFGPGYARKWYWIQVARSVASLVGGWPMRFLLFLASAVGLSELVEFWRRSK